MRLSGRTAVVTGAASGIGRAIAVSLGRRGCHVALSDVDEDGMAETAELVGAHGVRVSRHVLDVTDREAVTRFPEHVTGEHAGVDLLFNNAGVALGGTFEQVSPCDFEWLFEVNFWGVVRMTRAFLPHLRASDEGRIVNLSSVFGLLAPPEQVPYASSKFAVRGFSEALRHELEGSSVGVTVVHPGGVATSIAENAKQPDGASREETERRRTAARRLLVMPPERAGEIIVRGTERRKPRILVGRDAVAISLLTRLLPVGHWKLVAAGLRE